MKFEVLELSSETISLAPEFGRFPFSCKNCLYWESPEAFMDTSPGWEERSFRKKKHFIKALSQEIGSCGKILLLEGVGVGFSMYGPPSFFPNSRNYHSGFLSEEAIFLACLYIPEEKFRGLGLGEILLSQILEELKGEGYERLETFARRRSPENPSGPVEFFLKRGFSILRDDPEYPLVGISLNPKTNL